MMILVATLLGACLQSEGGGTAGTQGAKAGVATASLSDRARAAFDARRALVRFPRGKSVVAEIADTSERVALGYMYRDDVGESDGMVFVFPEPDVHPFWMKNTRVALDMIWMDESFNVLHIQPSAPPCKADPCASYGPPRKASYVLEVRGGTAAQQGLKVGDRLAIELPGPEGGGS
jgi:uncharacterized membrane protein (UPF0127 family)